MTTNLWFVLGATLMLLVGFTYMAFVMIQLCILALICLALYAFYRSKSLSLSRIGYKIRLFIYRHL